MWMVSCLTFGDLADFAIAQNEWFGYCVVQMSIEEREVEWARNERTEVRKISIREPGSEASQKSCEQCIQLQLTSPWRNLFLENGSIDA